MQELDQRFDDAAQREIINLAAELQRREAASLSRSELEEAAAEAGIDPRFVRRASDMLAMKTPLAIREPSTEPWSTVPVLALAALAMANCYGLIGTLSYKPIDHLLLFASVVAVGAIASHSLQQRLVAYVVSLSSSIAVLLWFQAPHQLLLPPLSSQNLTFAATYVAFQFVLLLTGQSLGRLTRWVRSRKDSQSSFHRQPADS
jgi:hypothetical protein